jgi:aryl-alcohol dehydrogenase-like predicted oxidoreductase
MQFSDLGKSGLRVSRVALGTWAMSNDPEWWGPADDNESIAAIHAALDAGVNLIDTAAAYGRGHAETLVGKALLGQRQRAVISSKCGLPWDASRPGAPIKRNLSAKSIFAECEGSLRRLRTDTIDIYFCHWPDPETPLSETVQAMEKLREQGKIRAVGMSNYGCEDLTEARQHGTVDAVQPPFNMFNRRAAEDLLPYCQEFGIAVTVYSPLCKGLLSGRFGASSKFTDLRASDPEFIGQRFQRNLAVVEQLRPIAANRGVSLAQLVLNWTLRQSGVSVVLAGAKRPSQVTENVGAVAFALREEEVAAIDRVLAEHDAGT